MQTRSSAKRLRETATSESNKRARAETQEAEAARHERKTKEARLLYGVQVVLKDPTTNEVVPGVCASGGMSMRLSSISYHDGHVEAFIDYAVSLRGPDPGTTSRLQFVAPTNLQPVTLGTAQPRVLLCEVLTTPVHELVAAWSPLPIDLAKTVDEYVSRSELADFPRNVLQRLPIGLGWTLRDYLLSTLRSPGYLSHILQIAAPEFHLPKTMQLFRVQACGRRCVPMAVHGAVFLPLVLAKFAHFPAGDARGQTALPLLRIATLLLKDADSSVWCVKDVETIASGESICSIFPWPAVSGGPAAQSSQGVAYWKQGPVSTLYYTHTAYPLPLAPRLANFNVGLADNGCGKVRFEAMWHQAAQHVDYTAQQLAGSGVTLYF